MKVTTILDPNREEEVVIYARERNELVEKIEQLASQNTAELVGFCENAAAILDYVKVTRFTAENGKIYAVVGGDRYQIRRRLYQLEQQMPAYFVKINQSCLANIRHIARFEAVYTGTLRVVFKNGDTDYVSRRNLKQIKERFGL